MCRVPNAPVDTEFIATDDQLRQGQTFTVKCTGTNTCIVFHFFFKFKLTIAEG